MPRFRAATTVERYGPTETGRRPVGLRPTTPCRASTPRRGFSRLLPLRQHAQRSLQRAALTAPQGDVLFGSGRPLHRFDPEAVAPRRSTTNCVSRGSTAQQTRLESRDAARSLVTDHRSAPQFRISHGVRLAHFCHQHIVGYGCKLEVTTTTGTSQTTNRATYSNVPIGSYTLHVRAFVGNADAAGEGITIGVSAPPGSHGGLKPLHTAGAGRHRRGLPHCQLGHPSRREASVEQNMT